MPLPHERENDGERGERLARIDIRAELRINTEELRELARQVRYNWEFATNKLSLTLVRQAAILRNAEAAGRISWRTIG